MNMKLAFSGLQQLFFVCAGFKLNNAWANSTVLRPFLQPENNIFSQEFGLWL